MRIPLPRLLRALLLIVGCSSGAHDDVPAADGSAPDHAEVAVDVGPPASIDAAPDAVEAADVPAVDANAVSTMDGGAGGGTDAPPATCSLDAGGWPVLAIVEARITANRFTFTTNNGAGCEGDIPGQVHVLRTLCGSVAADLDVAALTAPAPFQTGPLALGDDRLLVLALAGCPVYPRGSVYQVIGNRPPSDWDLVAGMLAGDRDR